MSGPLDAIKPQARAIAQNIGSLVAGQVHMQRDPEGFLISMVGQLAFLRSYEESLLRALAQASRQVGGKEFADEVLRVAGEVSAELTRDLEKKLGTVK